MKREMEPWLYVTKDRKGDTRPYMVNATDEKAAEDIAYEHTACDDGEVIRVIKLSEWLGADAIELREIGL